MMAMMSPALMSWPSETRISTTTPAMGEPTEPGSLVAFSRVTLCPRDDQVVAHKERDATDLDGGAAVVNGNHPAFAVELEAAAPRQHGLTYENDASSQSLSDAGAGAAASSQLMHRTALSEGPT